MGIELLDVPRFRSALTRFDSRLRERVFTEGERAYARARNKGEAQSLAVRFAAKCAARRALAAARGRDLPGVAWREIEVVRHPGRAPTLAFHGRAQGIASDAGIEGVSLSLTHDRSACMAHVVVEGAGRPDAGGQR